MISVTIDNEIREYPEGTAWLEIAQDYQHLYEDDILLVQVNRSRACPPISEVLPC